MTRLIVLAAGQGTRLYPLTANKPKCLVELLGKPLLQHQLDTCHRLGINDIHVIAGYKAECLSDWDIQLHFNPNYMSSNMVYTLFTAAEALNTNSDIVISYGDIVYEPRVLEALVSTNAPVSISVDQSWLTYWQARMRNPLDDAESLKITDGNKVIELGNKSSSYSDIQGQYMGLIKIRKDFVVPLINEWKRLPRDDQYTGQDFDNMYMTSFIQHLINIGVDVRASFVSNGWLEIDTLADMNIDLNAFFQPI